ncbi:FBP domain-containing protein [Jatrophihabitans sp. YIM 134969]
MLPLDKSHIQRALVNVTKSERTAVTFPVDFDSVPWDALDFFGWRDPKKPQRGYLVRVRDDGPVAVAVQTAAAPTATPRKAMCSICRAVDAASSIALFAARRTGPDGRKGDTVGTYICSGLDCSRQLRVPEPKPGRAIIGAQDADQDLLAAEMLQRLDGFLAAIGA